MFKKQIQFGRKHLFLTATNHFIGGFGLALLLQHYLAGNSFLPVWIGWILIAFTVGVHVYEFTR